MIDGVDVTGQPAHVIAARGVAQMPGGQGVFPTLTVAENLRVAGWLRRGDREALAADLATIESLFPVLRDRAGAEAGNLSGGQQQMLALAMSVLTRPKLLMIDELSLGLAPAVVGELLHFVDRLRAEGTTLVVVEQSVNVAVEIAERAVFMERGEVRFAGPSATCSTAPTSSARCSSAPPRRRRPASASRRSRPPGRGRRSGRGRRRGRSHPVRRRAGAPAGPVRLHPGGPGRHGGPGRPRRGRSSAWPRCRRASAACRRSRACRSTWPPARSSA